MSSAPSAMAASTSAKKTPKTRATTSGLTRRCNAVMASTSTTIVPAPRIDLERERDPRRVHDRQQRGGQAEHRHAEDDDGAEATGGRDAIHEPRHRQSRRHRAPPADSRSRCCRSRVDSCSMTTNRTVSVPYTKLARMLKPASSITVGDSTNAAIPAAICLSGPDGAALGDVDRAASGAHAADEERRDIRTWRH